ncbi:uncharacterized protein [Nicotiana tomentosiformis]|uniref:uncharacterized protein n=1 Tax=Nicotiana tomentosiformis TaxID=4098 RepID=UPI00388C5BC3
MACDGLKKERTQERLAALLAVSNYTESPTLIWGIKMNCEKNMESDVDFHIQDEAERRRKGVELMIKMICSEFMDDFQIQDEAERRRKEVELMIKTNCCEFMDDFQIQDEAEKRRKEVELMIKTNCGGFMDDFQIQDEAERA